MKSQKINPCHYLTGSDNLGNRSPGQARRGQKIQAKAFTLVELIIVITILAILRTIGFMSFQSYTADARDSNRVTSISEFKKGLEMNFLKDSKYPSPDGDIVLSGSINNKPLIYVGELGENISKTIRFTSTPKDPLTKTNYIYGTTSDYRYYQVASILEGDTAYTPIINTTFANTETAKVEGNYPGFIKFNSGSESWIANIPSLIFNNTGSVSDLLANTTYFVVNKKSNLPYNTKGIKDSTIQKLDGNNLIREITGTVTASLTGVNITNLEENNFEAIFTGATLASFNISGGDLSNKETIVSSLKTSILGTSATTATSPTNSCITQPTYSGATFTFGTPTSPNQEWQGTSSTGACYYTCGAGKVLDDNICVSETCSGTTPDGIAKVSNATSFAGGTWYYNPAGAKCSYTCGTGYHTEDSGASCIEDTKSCTISHGTGQQTWGGSSWGTCIVVSCDSGYNVSGNSCTDQTAPIGGSFTINNNAASTNTTAVTLNITCPTDAAGSTPIEVAYGNTANPTNWETCTTTKSHTLSTGDGTKTVYVRFRDSMGNVTGDVSDGISLVTIYKCFNDSNAILKMELATQIYYYCSGNRTFDNSVNPYRVTTCLSGNNGIKWISPAYLTEWGAVRYETTDVTTKYTTYSTANYNQYKCNAGGKCDSYSSIVNNMANGFNKDAYKVNLCEYSNENTTATTSATAYYMETTNGSRWETLANMFGNNSTSRQVTITHYVAIRALGSQSFSQHADLSTTKYWVEVRNK